MQHIVLERWLHTPRASAGDLQSLHSNYGRLPQHQSIFTCRATEHCTARGTKMPSTQRKNQGLYITAANHPSHHKKKKIYQKAVVCWLSDRVTLLTLKTSPTLPLPARRKGLIMANLRGIPATQLLSVKDYPRL